MLSLCKRRKWVGNCRSWVCETLKYKMVTNQKGKVFVEDSARRSSEFPFKYQQTFGMQQESFHKFTNLVLNLALRLCPFSFSFFYKSVVFFVFFFSFFCSSPFKLLPFISLPFVFQVYIADPRVFCHGFLTPFRHSKRRVILDIRLVVVPIPEIQPDIDSPRVLVLP